MKNHTIGTSWIRMLAVSVVAGALAIIPGINGAYSSSCSANHTQIACNAAHCKWNPETADPRGPGTCTVAAARP